MKRIDKIFEEFFSKGHVCVSYPKKIPAAKMENECTIENVEMITRTFYLRNERDYPELSYIAHKYGVKIDPCEDLDNVPYPGEFV